MTDRTPMEQRKRELSGKVFGRLANRSLSKKTTGTDGVAEELIAKQAISVDHDPGVDHSAEWDRPVD